MGGQMSVGKVGLVVAAVLAGWHLGWAILVAIGLAQPLIDFIFWIHFIRPVYVIEPFATVRAAILIIVTAGVGFLIGSAFALIWNAVHKT